MQIKTKKHNPDGIVRLETSGEIKEIIINEDFLHPKDMTVSICFKGKSSSGIIRLTPKEIDIINKKVRPSLAITKGVKIMKFDK